MIQRKQTIWLLIAAICSIGLFLFDFYHADVMVNGVATIHKIRVNDHYPSLLIALVLVALPLITVFMYKNRKRQKAMSAFAIVANVGFITMSIARVTNFNADTPAAVNGSYWVGAVIPVISMIFLFMAISGINKDEKLVKSLDRLR